MEQTVMPCPFCNSHRIGYSIKTMGRRTNKYHVAMYCKDCNCYGKRTIVDGKNKFRSGIEKIPEYKQLAIDAWNTRKPMERILERLEERRDTIYPWDDLETKRHLQLQNEELDIHINIVKEEGRFNV